MIGKPEWFSARKFGWGLGIKSKEGLAYLLAIVAIAYVATLIPMPSQYKLAVIAAIIGIVLIDTLHIMTKVYSKLDEREQKHQAFAERNASFVAIVCLVAYIMYFALTSPQNSPEIAEKVALPAAILVAMSIAKGATLIYLERKS